nr:hypothetical protein [Actinomadura rubrisoli]
MTAPKTGKALFEDVVREWGRLLTVYGTATIHLRSRQGFLERPRGGDEVIGAVRDAWERPVRSVMRALDVPDDQFDYALFLNNIIFDPREVLDLTAVGSIARRPKPTRSGNPGCALIPMPRWAQAATVASITWGSPGLMDFETWLEREGAARFSTS